MPETSPTPFRPHHALCVLFFEGQGYSQAFIQNMADFLGNPDQTVQISANCDILCQACPNNQGGQCLTENKASVFDERVLELIRPLLNTANPIPLRRLCQAAHSAILQTGKLNEVCGECEWAVLCQGKWERGDFNAFLLHGNASAEMSQQTC